MPMYKVLSIFTSNSIENWVVNTTLIDCTWNKWKPSEKLI